MPHSINMVTMILLSDVTKDRAASKSNCTVHTLHHSHSWDLPDWLHQLIWVDIYVNQSHTSFVSLTGMTSGPIDRTSVLPGSDKDYEADPYKFCNFLPVSHLKLMPSVPRHSNHVRKFSSSSCAANEVDQVKKQIFKIKCPNLCFHYM